MIDAIFVQNRFLFSKSPKRSAPSFTKTHLNLTCLLHTSSVFKDVLMPASQLRRVWLLLVRNAPYWAANLLKQQVRRTLAEHTRRRDLQKSKIMIHLHKV